LNKQESELLVEFETGRFLEINDHFCKILGYSDRAKEKF
jgi:hypothetical protein